MNYINKIIKEPKNINCRRGELKLPDMNIWINNRKYRAEIFATNLLDLQEERQ